MQVIFPVALLDRDEQFYDQYIYPMWCYPVLLPFHEVLHATLLICAKMLMKQDVLWTRGRKSFGKPVEQGLPTMLRNGIHLSCRNFSATVRSQNLIATFGHNKNDHCSDRKCAFKLLRDGRGILFSYLVSQKAGLCPSMGGFRSCCYPCR